MEFRALKDRIKNYRNYYKISDEGGVRGGNDDAIDVIEDVRMVDEMASNLQDHIYIDEEYTNNPKIDFDIRNIEYFDKIISDRLKTMKPLIQDDDMEYPVESWTTQASPQQSGALPKYFTTDDESVSSGSGDYGFERSLKINRDNVYSVSSEIILTNLMPKKKTTTTTTSTKGKLSPREPHLRSRTLPTKDNAHKDGMWLETRTRRILGNAKKSVERSKQLLLCEEVGSGELCRILFKGDIND